MKRSPYLFLFLIFCFCTFPVLANKNPKQLVEQMTEAIGGAEALRAKGDVEYVYIYRDTAKVLMDVSLERYIFDGELSWAKYPFHERFVFPGSSKVVLQSYNGKETTVMHGGASVEDPQAVQTADFLRKTNYYWFTMMFKLLDPGLTYAYKGKRQVGEVNYDLVEVGFHAGVGDVADTYLLYIHPRTKLVDRFLFTVMDFGKKEPFMMEVRYEEVDGLLLPTWRRYIASDWDGKITEDKWVYELSTNVRFSNGFQPDDFSLKK